MRFFFDPDAHLPTLHGCRSQALPARSPLPRLKSSAPTGKSMPSCWATATATAISTWFTAADASGGTGLYWENTSGDGSTWASAQATFFSFSNFGDAAAGDLDGDGDLDTVGVEASSNGFFASFNTAGDGSSWSNTGLTIGVLGDGTGVDVGDVDGDGDLDMVGAGTSGLSYFSNNNGNGTSWSSQTLVSGISIASVVIVDLDGDGDLDALATSSDSTSEVIWLENTAGDGSAWTEHDISTVRSDAESAEAGDIDGDGDLDVFFASPTDGLFAWAENTAGDGSAWTEHTIDTGATSPVDVYAADLDLDGDLDLVAADGSAFTVDWYENTAGDGSAWTQRSLQSSAGEARAVAVGDVDGDGDMDVVGTNHTGSALVWWENLTLHRSALFPDETTIEAAFTNPEDFAVGDIDGDGDPDVLGTAQTEDLTWWENTAGDGSAWTPHTVANLQGGSAVSVCDLDRDGDMDALLASDTDDIRWVENTAGDGSAWTVRVIDNTLSLALGVAAADMDGDGDPDVVATDWNNDDVLWFENTAGDALSWTKSTVAGSFNGAENIEAADMDGDGDMDILATAESASDVAWFENTAGDGSAWTEHTIDGSFGGADAVAAADVDGDGDMDAVGAANSLSRVEWWENTAGDGSAWTGHVVDSAFIGASGVGGTDLDGDGDLDVLGAGTGIGLRWWENTVGDGTVWSAQTLDTPFIGATRMRAADVDGDGDSDILGSTISADDIAWWPNRGGQFALPTSDEVVDPEPMAGETDVLLLQVDAAHRGRTGDGDLELVTFELLFEETVGDPLTGAELEAIVSVVRIYHDDGDGIFETDGSDFNFHSVAAPFTLVSGVLTTTFVDGEADVQVAFGTDETYFVAVDIQPSADSAMPSTLLVTHLTSSSSTGEMTSTDIPLVLEAAEDVSSSQIDASTNLPPVVDSPIEDVNWTVDVLVDLDISGSFSDPDGDTLTFTATGGPASISLSTAGLFSGLPAAGDPAGSPFTITVRATDPDGLFVEDTFEATVEEAPPNPLPVGGTTTLPSSIDGAEAVAVGDLDGDGDLDLVTLATDSADLLWWQNTSGDGSTWSSTTIDGTLAQGQEVKIADVDSDGDLDVITAAGDEVAWYENTSGDGSTWSAHTVDAAVTGVSDVVSCDLDGDGTLDIAAGAAGADRVYAWLNTSGDGSVWSGGDFGTADATAVDCGDVDRDGDPDLFATSTTADRITYWLNTNATFGGLLRTPAFTSPDDLLVGDVDGDGDLDHFFTTDSGDLAWSENLDGSGLSWSDRQISDTFSSPSSIQAADLDMDGDLDVAAADASGFVSWWENLQSDGQSWIERPVVTMGIGTASALILADVDGDGDLDFVVADSTGDAVKWIENETLHRSAFFATETIVAGSFDGAISVRAADLDGDGDLDLLGTASQGDEVSWWRNDDGTGGAWSELSIVTSFDFAVSARAADMDGDGDLDVLACSPFDDDVTWWENTAGDATTWTQHLIDGGFDGARSVEPADMDGDGDVDVVGVAFQADHVVWWENTAGDGTAWTEQAIDLAPKDVSVLLPTDIDSDGDIDVAVGGDDFTWYENADGIATVWNEHSVTGSSTLAIDAADIDGDGDTDLLNTTNGSIGWWQNTSGDGSVWVEHILDSSFSGAHSIFTADVDADGDFDVISAAEYDNTIVWWENVTGDGSVWSPQTVSVAVDSPSDVATGDVDGDGDTDLLVTSLLSDNVAWWENRGGQFALPTTDAVTAERPITGSTDVLLLSIEAAHRGRTGDGDLELTSFELLLEEAQADPLSDAELDSIVSNLRIVWDDGDGIFETDGSDATFLTFSAPFTLASGVLTAAFDDGAAEVQVTFGADETYFVVVDLQADADVGLVDSLIVTHLTESSSTAEMSSTDLPLTLEFAANVSSTTLVGFDNVPPLVGSIADVTWYVGAQLSLNVAESFEEPNGESMGFSAVGLPTSISMAANGTLSGLPTAGDVSGSPYVITVRATDELGLFAEGSFQAQIIAAPAVTVAVGGAQNIVPSQDGSDDLVFGDLDGDGALDLVLAASNSADVTWWRNVDGDGSSWSLTTIDGAFAGADSVAVGDLDGDGSLDVLASARTADTLAWFENTAGDGSVWTKRILDAAFDGPVDAEPGDMDGDGDLDVVAGAMDGDELAWFENTAGNGTAWTKIIVDGSFDASSVNCRDLDRDGDLDILAASFADDLVSWFENTAGDGSVWTEHTISGAFTGPKDVLARDVDGDGDWDVLLAADGSVAWSENVGDGSTWIDHLISDSPASPMAIRAADVDLDGDLDVVSADADGLTVSWWQNLDGTGASWTERPVIDAAGSTAAVAVRDVDGDGDVDFTVSDSIGDTVEWIANETLHRSAFFPTPVGEHLIEDAFTGVYDVEAVDMDGDGDLDALTAAIDSNDVVWWQNVDGDGTTWTKQTIEVFLDDAIQAKAADFDGDGDLDVVGAGQVDTVRVWLNLDGNATSWSATDIDTSFFGGHGLDTGDVDGDGDVDVLGAAETIDDVTWFENGGDGLTWTRRTIDPVFDGARAVAAADVDGDGDVDALAAAGAADEIAWWENTAGDGTAWTEHTVDGSFGGAIDVGAADVDGDGDLDVVGAAETDHQISWWQNTAGDGTAWTEMVVTAAFPGARSVFARDLDDDGDLDLVATAGNDARISWFENTSGDGTTWSEHVVTSSFTGPATAVVGDLDGDGDQDLLGTSVDLDDLIWWENLGGQFALPTTDAVVSTTPLEGSTDVLLLQIDAEHRGRSGDGDLELATLELLFEAAAGDPLSAAELTALADTVRLHRDDGDGVFETDGSDTAVFTASDPFTLVSGVLTVPFTDGAAEAQVTFGTDQTYFVAVDLSDTASGATPNTLRVTHLTQSSSTAEMTSSDVPLTLEYQADTTSSTITATSGLAEITVTPLAIDFGSWSPDEGPSGSESVTITNDGTADLNVSQVELTGDDAGEFQIVGDSGETVLAPGGTRTVDVVFDPSSLGAKQATLRISSDDADESVIDVDLSGLGADLIFRDGFEDGTTGAWSSTLP